MARPFTPLPEGTEERMVELLKEAKTAKEVRRIQCVLLRVRSKSSSKDISEIVGLHPSSVRRVWTQYLDEGETALIGEKRGGRYRAYLSTEEESSILEPFADIAKNGEVVAIRMVYNAYCKTVGREVAESTVYRMLSRHGWRKIVPRPSHPKANKESQKEFRESFSPGG